MSGTPKTLVVNSFGGLQLDRAELSRQNNTFSVLTNFILDRTGAIRAIEKPINIGHTFGTPVPSPVVFVGNYRRNLNSEERIIVLCLNGQLFDYDTGLFLTQFQQVNVPFVGHFIKKFKDPLTNLVEDITYLIVTVANGPAYKWNGVVSPSPGFEPTVLGVAPAITGGYIAAFFQQFGSLLGGTDLDNNEEINLDGRGIKLVISRRYSWTYFNSITGHESSPAPFSEFLTLYPNKNKDLFYTSVILILPTAIPTYGDTSRYTGRRIYATRDGESELFLCQNIYGADENFSVALNMPIVFDGLPLFDNSPYWNQFGPNIESSADGFEINGILPDGVDHATVRNLIINDIPVFQVGDLFISNDSTLVEPAPDDNEHDPPPASEFGAIYQNRLFLIDKTRPIDVRFSKIGDFESFPKDNVISRPSNFYSDVISLINYNRRLIIAKNNQLTQLVGIDFSDFTIVDIDDSIGVTSRRSASVREDVMFFISPSLALSGLANETVQKLSESIKPFIDANIDFTDVEKNTIVQDAQRDLVLYSMRTKNDRNVIIIQDISEQFPFSIMTGINSKVYSLQQVLIDTGNYKILAGCEDGNVYEFFNGVQIDGALAETQFLPQDNLYSRKVFRHLRVEGLETIPTTGDILVAFQIDEKPYTVLQRLREIHAIGLSGQRLKIKFLVSDFSNQSHDPVLIQGFKLDYVDLGVPR